MQEIHFGIAEMIFGLSAGKWLASAASLIFCRNCNRQLKISTALTKEKLREPAYSKALIQNKIGRKRVRSKESSRQTVRRLFACLPQFWPLPIDFVLVNRLWVNWFLRLRFCGRSRNQNFTITIRLWWMVHWRRLDKNIEWANQNIEGQKVVKSDKCMGDSKLFWEHVPAPLKINYLFTSKHVHYCQKVGKTDSFLSTAQHSIVI